jgi:hypothetical protein
MRSLSPHVSQVLELSCPRPDGPHSTTPRRARGSYLTLTHGEAKKQSVVSRSAMETKYIAMSLVLREMIWVRNILSKLKILRKVPMKVWPNSLYTKFP